MIELQKGVPLDLYALMRKDPELGQKVRYLLEMGIFNAQYQR